MGLEFDESYMAEVKAFAKKIGLLEQLEKQLSYLANYANHDGIDKTVCRLWKDFAPYSFTFDMVLRKRKYTRRTYECDKCGEKIPSESLVDLSDCPLYTYGEENSTKCDGKLRQVDVQQIHQEEERWFNGGLIYHGPHDRGGDGGAPTFSVNLVATDGWLIHT